ncbi:MAG: EutN/CcmL family microcompartment protein [Sulfitobacter sp.]|nr:EutN/CcmL family microcompartment protein [Sulfitobacter sp.]
MFLGRVIGQVWATHKVADLSGKRLLLVDPLEPSQAPPDPAAPMVKPVVAADGLGARVGQRVLVAFGKAARVAAYGVDGDYALEASVVALVDELEAPNTPASWHESDIAPATEEQESC